MPFHFSSLGLLAISALTLLKNYFRDAAILQFLFIKLEEVKVRKNHIVPVVSAVWMKNLMVINGLSLIKIFHMCKNKYNFITLYMLCFCSCLRMLPKTLGFVQTFCDWWKLICFLNFKMWREVVLIQHKEEWETQMYPYTFSHLNFISVSSTFFPPQAAQEQPSDSLLALLHSCWHYNQTQVLKVQCLLQR